MKVHQQNVTVADEPLHQRMNWNGSLSREELLKEATVRAINIALPFKQSEHKTLTGL